MEQKQSELKVEPTQDELVCYCFGYSPKDIENDLIENHGKSLILDRIMSEKKAGRCECASKNPKGR